METYPLYLNGKFEVTDTFRAIVNPATGEAFAKMSVGSRAMLSQALQDAASALKAWQRTTGKERGEFLDRIADQLQENSQELAETVTLENGKTLTQSRAEVAAAIDHLRWFSEEARRAYGRIIPNQVAGKRHLIIKSPIGVVGAISPWNFPVMLAVRKIAPALAAGCTVVLKPASQTPLSAVAVARAAHAAGLPPGALQLVAGPAEELGAEFLENPICRKITFTGSTEVGRRLIAGAADSVKPLSLELGGHAPVIVFDDIDMDRAIEGVLAAKFRNNGQSCIAANRIYVQRGLYERFVQEFASRVSALKVADGLEPGADIGPLVDQAGLKKALEHINDALARGARLVCGGKRIDRQGFFLEPTVLADVPEDAVCMSEETFAPVAAFSPFDEEEEAISRANATIYGLSAYAFTTDLDRTFRLMESLQAGTIAINDGVPSTSQSPFGGVKQSGWGRELGMEGMDAFLETKHISLGLRL